MASSVSVVVSRTLRFANNSLMTARLLTTVAVSSSYTLGLAGLNENSIFGRLLGSMTATGCDSLTGGGGGYSATMAAEGGSSTTRS